MKKFRWFSPAPLALALVVLNASASASSIRDEAGMFSADAVRAATAQLDRFEKATKVPVLIETVGSLSLDRDAPKAERYRAIGKLAESRDRKNGNHGIYLLISREDKVISNTLIPGHLAVALPEATREQIRESFIQGIGSHMRGEGRKTVEQADQDAGLKSLASAIERTTEQVVRGAGAARHLNPAPANGPRPMDARPGIARGGGSSMTTFLMIGLGILAVLFFVRVLGGLFGGGNPAGMGGMGPGSGMRGPGYGGPGYGGGGGGFFSGMLGGLGGALAGNWLYDQFSGRHGGSHYDSSAYPTSGDAGGYYSQGDEPIVGGDDGGSGGASWGDAGGGDWGGGDGGGDWGGGGGDWGGGGGDGGDW